MTITESLVYACESQRMISENDIGSFPACGATFLALPVLNESMKESIDALHQIVTVPANQDAWNFLAASYLSCIIRNSWGNQHKSCPSWPLNMSQEFAVHPVESSALALWCALRRILSSTVPENIHCGRSALSRPPLFWWHLHWAWQRLWPLAQEAGPQRCRKGEACWLVPAPKPQKMGQEGSSDHPPRDTLETCWIHQLGSDHRVLCDATRLPKISKAPSWHLSLWTWEPGELQMLQYPRLVGPQPT